MPNLSANWSVNLKCQPRRTQTASRECQIRVPIREWQLRVLTEKMLTWGNTNWKDQLKELPNRRVSTGSVNGGECQTGVSFIISVTMWKKGEISHWGRLRSCRSRSKLEEKHDIHVTSWSQIGKISHSGGNRKSVRTVKNIGWQGLNSRRQSDQSALNSESSKTERAVKFEGRDFHMTCFKKFDYSLIRFD